MSFNYETLSRDMSLFDITMIGVGAMIGAGIFVLTGEAAGVAGPALILSFALNGVVTIFTAMVYAELGSAIPEAGGGYLWVKEGLPGANAFLAGWMSWFAHAVAGALYALGFGAFVYELLRLAGVDFRAMGLDFMTAKKIFGVLAALAFAYINYRGASETGLAGNIVTVAKVIVIGLFCLFGIKYMFFPHLWFTVGHVPGGMGTAQLQPFISDKTGWGGIITAMGLTFIAFEGYEIIVQAGEEVVDPRKNIPKAVFWSLAIVVPIYMVVAFVLIGASNSAFLVHTLQVLEGTLPAGVSAHMPNWQILGHLKELGLAQAASQFVPYGAVLILVGATLSTMSALNATTFSSTRVAFAMGRDKNLPDMFGHISSTRRTPSIAVVWTAGLIGIMVAFVPITTVAAAADIMFLLLFLQVNVAVITIRKKYGDKLAYGYLLPFFPLIPILGIITKLGLALFMFKHYPMGWMYVLIWLAIGLGLYWFYARPRDRQKAAPPVLVEERPAEFAPRSVLVPVAAPEPAKRHIDLAVEIARRRNSGIVLMHAIAVPQQLPPSAASDFVAEARPLLDELRRYTEQFGVPVATMIRVGHRPAEAIIHTAQDKNIEFLVMGWKGTVHHEDTVIGTNIDHVLAEAHTHSIVVQAGEVPKRQRVLVPLANPQSAPLSLAVASLVNGEHQDVPVTIMHATGEPLDDAAKKRFEQTVRQSLESAIDNDQWIDFPHPPLEFVFVVADDPIAEIGRRSANFDRIIVGTSEASVFRPQVFGHTPLRIVSEARCPAILVRRRQAEIKTEIQKLLRLLPPPGGRRRGVSGARA